MNVVAFDLETHRFRQAEMAPKPVCLSWALDDRSGLMLDEDIEQEFGPTLEAASRGEVKLVGHSVAYDMACLAAWHPPLRQWIWDAYVAGAVECTAVREKLLDIAEGTLRGQYMQGEADFIWKSHGYGLDNLASRWLDTTVDKTNPWRVNFRDLDGVPLNEWPELASSYAIGDSTTCLRMYKVQESRSIERRYPLEDSESQSRADFALRLASIWGIRTNEKKLHMAWATLTEKFIKAQAKLEKYGLFNAKKGSKEVKKFQELIVSICGNATKRTEKGNVKTDEDTLQDIDHPVVEHWVMMMGLQKTRGYIKRMFGGIEKPLHTNFDVLVNTGRCSSSGPRQRKKGGLDPIPGMNVQNFPREPGVRECVEARDGYVFLNADYDSQEMRTLAQACMSIVGTSVLAERYRADRYFDPHTMFAGKMQNIEYDAAMKLKEADDESMLAARQQCKIANFGLPGGMGPRGLVGYARGYEDPVTHEPFRLSLHEAQKLKSWWLLTWPEMAAYFRHIKLCVGTANSGTITMLVSGRRRGDCGFTDGANTYFQGGASDISKAMFFEISRRCYSVRNSALYGSRPCNFIHDEAMLESPEARAPDAAVETTALMVEIMERYTPDVPAAASATLSRFWSKKTKRIVDENGRLMVWEPTATAKAA